MNWRYYKIRGRIVRTNSNSTESYYKRSMTWGPCWQVFDIKALMIDRPTLTESDAFLEMI